MWEENNFAVSLRVKRGHGYFLLASLTVPVSGIFSSFDRVARNVPLDEEMNNVRSMGPDRPNNANLCPKKWWRYIRIDEYVLQIYSNIRKNLNRPSKKH